MDLKKAEEAINFLKNGSHYVELAKMFWRLKVADIQSIDLESSDSDREKGNSGAPLAVLSWALFENILFLH